MIWVPSLGQGQRAGPLLAPGSCLGVDDLAADDGVGDGGVGDVLFGDLVQVFGQDDHVGELARSQGAAATLGEVGVGPAVAVCPQRPVEVEGLARVPRATAAEVGAGERGGAVPVLGERTAARGASSYRRDQSHAQSEPRRGHRCDRHGPADDIQMPSTSFSCWPKDGVTSSAKHQHVRVAVTGYDQIRSLAVRK